MSNRSNWFKAIAFLPILIIVAITINTVSCKSGSEFGTSDSGSGGGGKATPTKTPTPKPGVLPSAYATNFVDGMVSEFSRNPSTGTLTLNGTVAAGATSGPKGIAIDQTNSFAYVVNNSDGKIYEFSIDPTTGALTSIGSINNGAATSPELIVISPSNKFAWVTNSGTGSVTSYTINKKTGLLSKNGSALTGFSKPFGIAVHPTLSFLFVGDMGNGKIFPATISGSGTLTLGTGVLSSKAGATEPEFLAIDPSSGSPVLWVTDQKKDVISPFAYNTSTGALTADAFTDNVAGATGTLGIGMAAPTGEEFLFTGNQTSNNVSMFSVSGTTLTASANPGNPFPTDSPPSADAPTQVVVDPADAFVYVADQGTGAITVFAINGAGCSPAPCLGFVAHTATENTTGSPFGIALTH